MNKIKILIISILSISVIIAIIKFMDVDKVNGDSIIKTNAIIQDNSINVKDFGAKGDGVANDTKAIKAALKATPQGGELVFPLGTYKHTGFTITKPLNIKGASKYGTRLINTGKGTSITIAPNVERGTIKDISIFGNGTKQYGIDATSGKGIVFKNNSVVWTLDNVWMRGHGDWFLYADGTGHVNNINILNSEFEWGKKGAIHFIQTNYENQINAVNILNSNFSYFGDNIIELWGQSITVQNNAIQATKKRGVVIDGSISPTGPSSSRAIRIDNNYFELNDYGFIYVKAVDKPFPRYAFGVSITNNFGIYTKEDVNPKKVSLVEVTAPDLQTYDNNQISGFVYTANAFDFDGTGKAVLNGNDVLGYNSIVQRGSGSNQIDTSNYIGLGKAKLLDTFNDSGTTSERPKLARTDAGKQYFDTTLNKPIWWNGSYWVDANGDRL